MFIAMMIVGAAFVPVLDVRFKPTRELPQLTVQFSLFGASPSVVEEQTSKIEGILGKISEVKSITSTSGIGFGRVTLSLDKKADLNRKRYEVSMLIRQLRGNLPENMSYPEMVTNNIDDGEQTTFMVLTLNANNTTWDIGKTAERMVVPALSKIEGISDVTCYGATPHQWEVRFDPALLKNYAVTPSEIEQAVNQLGEKQFLGNRSNGNGAVLPVLFINEPLSPEEWRNLPVAKRNNRIVKLQDIATVKLREKPPTSYFRINGKNTINLVVSSVKGVNQLKVAENIYEKLNEIKQQLPPSYKLQIASDSTVFVKEELNKIGTRTFFSLAILLLFVLLTTRSFRILGILFVALAANLLIACIFYYILKIEIHLYSLAGITVSFGIIIDNSILMVTHLQKQRSLRVFLGLLGATLTTLGALSVVFFLEENQKILLLDFTWVLLINLSVSLVVSLTLVPALMELFYKKETVHFSIKRKRSVVRFSIIYEKFITFGKKRKWAFIVLLILGFGLPVWMLPETIEQDTWYAKLYNKTLGTEVYKTSIKPVVEKILGGTLRLFVQNVYEGSFYADPGKTSLYVSGRMPEGCTIEQMNESVKKMEQYISKFPEVEQFETRISGYRNSYIVLSFTKEAENSSFPYILKSQLESKAISLGGMDWSIWGVGKGFSNSLNSDFRSNHILLTGYNYHQLYNFARQLEQQLLKYDRVEKTEITSSNSWYSDSRYEYNLEIDKNLLAVNNLGYADFTQSLFTVLYSRNLSPYYNKNELQPVVLISNESDTYNKWNFYNMPVSTVNGDKKLSFGGKISKQLTGKSIEKKDQVYQMYLNYNFIGPGPLAEMVQEREIKAFNETLPLGFKAQKPESPFFFWDKKDKKQYWLLLLIITIIWFITSILFESLLKPLAVIVLIPISFIGVFLTFYLFGFNFDQGGFASFILLCGLVVNAAIYIINDMNNLVSRKGRYETIQTYVKAYNQKIIPIMLTILSTVLGLIPFIWGGQNEVFWFAFAVGASGGLIFSLIAIIVFLPIFLKLKIKQVISEQY